MSIGEKIGNTFFKKKLLCAKARETELGVLTHMYATSETDLWPGFDSLERGRPFPKEEA